MTALRVACGLRAQYGSLDVLAGRDRVVDRRSNRAGSSSRPARVEDPPAAATASEHHVGDVLLDGRRRDVTVAGTDAERLVTAVSRDLRREQAPPQRDLESIAVSADDAVAGDGERAVAV